MMLSGTFKAIKRGDLRRPGELGLSWPTLQGSLHRPPIPLLHRLGVCVTSTTILHFGIICQKLELSKMG